MITEIDRETIEAKLKIRGQTLAIQMDDRGQSIEEIGDRVILGLHYLQACFNIYYDILKEMKVVVKDEKMDKEIRKSFQPVFDELVADYVRGT